MTAALRSDYPQRRLPTSGMPPTQGLSAYPDPRYPSRSVRRTPGLPPVVSPPPLSRSERRDRLQSPPYTSRKAAPPMSRPVVRSLSRRRSLPIWLKLLVRLQKTSSLLTYLMIGSVLMTYGWTVFTQQRWGHEYRHWESLQKQEQQLLATNEVLKNQMAQQAESPAVGLVNPDPANMVFLAPAPQRSTGQSSAEAASPEPVPVRPLGY